MAAVTGVDPMAPAVNGVYRELEQQLPSTNDLRSFVSANQVGIAKLGKRIACREDGPHASGLDVADQPRHHVLVYDRRAGEGQIAQIEGSKVEIDHRAGAGAGTGLAATAFKRPDQRWPTGTANNVGDNRNGLI